MKEIHNKFITNHSSRPLTRRLNSSVITKALYMNSSQMHKLYSDIFSCHGEEKSIQDCS